MAAPLARVRWFAKLQARELRVPARLIGQYLRTSAGISKGSLLASVEDNLRFVLPEAWAKFPGRALILVGQRERRLMRESASGIHRALPGSELITVGGCGHGIPLERAAWFNALVGDWLRQTS
ncbi:alpha/beta hydrolase [Leucobacter allii]|uniref:Alpha/beta hydrolase n=1 Tax=Leucobacter allii TaxID=2932247 RepID=A0ABY4FJI5_9MICO|nr:alpha/beta hydrolase [Leucobacter allii]UOQ56142.1 alpha/beta hydrolase [Leucobacter allii]